MFPDGQQYEGDGAAKWTSRPTSECAGWSSGSPSRTLADAIGYRSRSAVAKIESGASELPVSKLLGLSEALDMPVEEILGSSYRGPGAPATRRRSRSGARTAAVVLAGGRSTRNLKNIPNQFTNVLGRPVISYCLETYQNHPLVDDIYVVCPPEWKNVVNAYARRFGIAKLADVVSPGPTGAASAKIGLERILRDGYRESDFVIFQESTRPLVSEEFISRLLRDCMERGTAIACEKASERMQFLRREDGSVEYVDRDSLVRPAVPRRPQHRARQGRLLQGGADLPPLDGEQLRDAHVQPRLRPELLRMRPAKPQGGAPGGHRHPRGHSAQQCRYRLSEPLRMEVPMQKNAYAAFRTRKATWKFPRKKEDGCIHTTRNILSRQNASSTS